MFRTFPYEPVERGFRVYAPASSHRFFKSLPTIKTRTNAIIVRTRVRMLRAKRTSRGDDLGTAHLGGEHVGKRQRMGGIRFDGIGNFRRKLASSEDHLASEEAQIWIDGERVGLMGGFILIAQR